MNLSEPFIHRPVATILIMLALVFGGILGYRSLPVSNLPIVDFPTISVSAGLPGASPEVMAAAVATPLERQFSAIPGLEGINSNSSQGTTQITLQFSLDRNIDSAAMDVQAAISAAGRQLPTGMPSPPTFRKANPAAAPILFIAVHSPTLLLSKVDEIAQTLIAQRLSMLDGVAQVNVFGSQKYALRVELDPGALASRGLGLEDVAQALDKGNPNLPAGSLLGTQNTWALQADGRLAGPEAFRRLVVAYRDGAPVRLGDLGRVVDSVENTQGASWYKRTFSKEDSEMENGAGKLRQDERAVVLAIERQPGSNTIKVADSIIALLPGLRAQMPTAVTADVVYSRAESIHESVNDVQFTLILAVFLVVLVIFLFLRNAAATLIPSLALPASVISTFGAMSLLSFSLDNISLMALTLCTGFVVDDAIVVLENIVRRMELGEDPWEAAINGSREIGFTVVAMTVSLVAVFIPILFMGGIMGRIFNEFGVTISVAILVSGFVALTLTPMLAARMLRPPKEHHGFAYNALEGVFQGMRNAYSSTLEAVLVHRRLTLGMSGLLLVVTIWLFGVVPKGFIPSEDSGLLSVSTEGAQGITFADMAAHQKAVTDIIAEDPNIEAYTSSVGAGGRNSSGNQGSMFLRLKPRSERPLDADGVVQVLRAKMVHLVGIRVFITNPPSIRIGGQISKSQYQLTLQSLDTPLLQESVPKLVDALQDVPGLQDVTSDQQLTSPQVKVEIDRERAAALGVTAAQIESTLSDAFGQRQVSTLFGAGDQFKVLMGLAPKFQADPSALERLYVRTTAGKVVPLGALAKLRLGTGPVSVSHVGPYTATTVSFNLKPGVSLSQATSKVESVAREVLPEAVSANFKGTAKEFQASTDNLGLLLILAIVVIYIVLGILYESFVHPLTVLAGLPSAGLGALVTLLLFGRELDLYAFVGLIMLIGIVKKNAIILIDFALDAQRTRGAAPEAAIREACAVRFRPIMMTTVCALVGTLPIALGLGAGGEARQSLGLAVVGGLLVSQLLTLYITPVVYLYLENLTKRRINPQLLPEPSPLAA